MTDPDVQAVKGGPSEAAIEVARDEHRRARDELEFFGASEPFTRSPLVAALEAAYAVDVPRIRADERERVVRETVEWLREQHPRDEVIGRDLSGQPVHGPSWLSKAADAVAREFIDNKGGAYAE